MMSNSTLHATITADELWVQNSRIHLSTGRVEGPLGEVMLTRLELEILRYLLQHKGQPVDRQELLVSVWGYGPRARTRTVDTTIGRLRRKLRSTGTTDSLITTVHGFGYRMEAFATKPDISPSSVEAFPFFGDPEQVRLLRAQLATSRRLLLVGSPGVGTTRMAREVLAGERPNIVPLDHSAPDLQKLAVLFDTVPTERPVLIDGLGPLSPTSRKSLDTLLETVPQLVVLTSRRDPGLKTSVQRLPPLSTDRAVALFHEVLATRDPGIAPTLEHTLPWVEACDHTPLDLVNAPHQIHSQAQYEEGPDTIDLGRLNPGFCATIRAHKDLHGPLPQLAAFPGGLTWREVRQLWPACAPRLTEAFGHGLVFECGGRLVPARRTSASCGYDPSKLFDWIDVPRLSPQFEQIPNLHELLARTADPRLRRTAISHLAVLLRRHGGLEQLIEVLDEEIDRGSPYPELHFERGMAHLTMGRPGHALADLEAYRTSCVPNSPAYVRVTAACLHARIVNRDPQAEADLEAYLGTPHPTHEEREVKRHLASIAVRRRRFAECRHLCRSSLLTHRESEADAETLRLYILEASATSALGLPEEAYDRFIDAIRLAESLGEVFLAGQAKVGAGCAALVQGRTFDAIPYFEQAAKELVQQPPQRGNALNNLGICHVLNAAPDRADAPLRQALLLGERLGHPRLKAVANANLGLARHLELRFEEAEGRYRRAQTRLADDDPLTYDLDVFIALVRWHRTGRFELPAPPPSSWLWQHQLRSLLQEVVQEPDDCPHEQALHLMRNLVQRRMDPPREG